MSIDSVDPERIDAYWRARTAIDNPEIASRHRESDAKVHDLLFVERFVTAKCRVLDLGAGSCVLADRVADIAEVSEVRAVEKFGEFFAKRPAHQKVTTFAGDARDYRDGRSYDLILLFGVINYFGDQDVARIYDNVATMLAPGGTLLVKHQCGVTEDVKVDQFSQELGQSYQAVYRSREHDTELLAPHFRVDQVIDVYPPALNRWSNTRFYGFVCRAR